MPDLAISVRSLGKLYALGERRAGYRTLRESLASLFSRAHRNGNSGPTEVSAVTDSSAARPPLARNPARRGGGAANNTFWALRDVSFDVHRGEIVGIIGRNGAGKSTLLKILSRITEPTSGEVEISGRTGSLLEVGTGFHPELTGRENIFLNGAILGMKRAEIAARFDEIISFAGTEKFLDTPVKYYSSGMYMRLAFAIAAHLEPEILIVDEVLAVGDAEFQKKCLGKMGDVAKSGRTVLFVSHSMHAVNALCSRTILLKSGKITCDGRTSEIVARYYAEMLGQVDSDGDLTSAPRIGTGKARFTSISIAASSTDGLPIRTPETGCNLTMNLGIEARSELPESNVAVIIYDSTGYRLIDANLNQQGKFLQLNPGEKATVCFQLRQLLLKPATYRVGLWIGRGGIEEIDGIDCAATFDVAPNAKSQLHSFVFPGPYLCGFEPKISIVQEQVSVVSRSERVVERPVTLEP